MMKYYTEKFSEIIKRILFSQYVIATAISLVLSQIILYPGKKLIALILAACLTIIYVYLKNEIIILIALFIAFFPNKNYNLLGNTTNIILIFTFAMLFAKTVIHGDSIISLRRIFKNPFFPCSIAIWLSYLLVFMHSLANDLGDTEVQIEYFIGISLALTLANLIIGYVKSVDAFYTIRNLLFTILCLNLLFGIIFLIKPGLTIVPGIIQDQTVYAGGAGSIRAMRLGGLTFFWEAYAEYLMMASIVLCGLLANRVYADRKYINGLVAFVFAFTFLELLLTNTRGPIVLSLFGIFLIIYIFSNISIIKKVGITLLVLAMLATTALLAYKTGSLAVFGRMQSFEDVELTEYGYMPADRANVWLPALNYAIDHGFMGFGPSMLPLTSYSQYQGILLWPHNIILLMLITVGVIGLGAYLVLYMRMILLSRKISTIENSQIRQFYKFLLLSLILFSIDTLKFDGFLRTTNNYFYHIWIIIGVMFSSFNFTRNNDNA